MDSAYENEDGDTRYDAEYEGPELATYFCTGTGCSEADVLSAHDLCERCEAIRLQDVEDAKPEAAAEVVAPCVECPGCGEFFPLVAGSRPGELKIQEHQNEARRLGPTDFSFAHCGGSGLVQTPYRKPVKMQGELFINQEVA